MPNSYEKSIADVYDTLMWLIQIYHLLLFVILFSIYLRQNKEETPHTFRVGAKLL